MISTKQQYTLNGKKFYIDLNKVPTFSDKSLKILGSAKNLPRLQTFHLPKEEEPVLRSDAFLSCLAAHPEEVARMKRERNIRGRALPLLKNLLLEDRIRSLQKAANLLRECQDHSITDKIFTFLKTAFLASLVTASILAILFGGEVGVLLGTLGCIAAVMGSFIMTLLSANRIDAIEPTEICGMKVWKFPGERRSGNPFLILGAPILAFILPFYEVFTREARLQRLANKLNTSVQFTISQYQNTNQEILPRACGFYREKTADLQAKLQQKITELQEDLAAAQKMHHKTSAQIELNETLSDYKILKSEFETVSNFYQSLS